MPAKPYLSKKAVASVGNQYGRLTVISVVRAGVKGKSSTAACRCECGVTKDVALSSLWGGMTRSCGCLMRETASRLNRKHGLSGTPEHAIWMAIIQRCDNAKSTYYHNYGGRGVKLCSRWRDFAMFIMDMGPRPTLDHSIEREDNNGDYEPGNCRWATWAEQCNNKRRTRWFTINGITKNTTQWAKHAGIDPVTMHHRLEKWGATERAISKRPDEVLSRVGYRGVGRVDGSYQARIRVNGKLRVIGRFTDPISAAHAYDKAAIAQWGAIAKPNFEAFEVTA